MTQKVIEVNAELQLTSLYLTNIYVPPIGLGPYAVHDYNYLYHKPKINGKTLKGDLKWKDLGITFASYDETMAVLNS